MRPTIATVCLSAISENLKTAQRLAPESKIMAVIKGNAYGHGMVEIARELQEQVPAFAVAFIDEAVKLRAAGISRPILVLQGSSNPSDVAEAADKDFWLMLHSQQQVQRILSASIPKPVTVWVKVDTGMNRLGLNEPEIDDAFKKLSASVNVHAEMVLCSHLACADEADNQMTINQIRQSKAYAQKFDLPLSLANSAGIMSWPQSHAQWNRPGYMLYGNAPMQAAQEPGAALIPAMSMESRIISIRDISTGQGVGYGQKWLAKRPSKVATIPIGYADGYPRHAKNGCPVLVNGQRASLVGRVSMDMISVDLSGLERVEVGDPVELWGRNLSVNEVAVNAETIGYEILAGLTGRVPITYKP